MPGRRKIIIGGEEFIISIPPSEEDWDIVDKYLTQLSAFNRRLLKAIVALEKKVHWGVPTSPQFKRRVCDCRRPDEPADYDPLKDDEGDDPDRPGSGEGPPDWGGN